MHKVRYLAILILIFGSVVGWGFVNRVEMKQTFLDWREKRDLPPAVSSSPSLTQQDKKITSDKQSAGGDSLPFEINIAAPFISQAPYAVWDKLHDEACEEASLIMFEAFNRGVKSIGKEEAELAIQNLVKWEKETFGYFEDTSAEQNIRILKEYFKMDNARAVYDISLEDIKKELSAGQLVVVPAAGKLLKNPYFRGGGPLYHMLVIKGYTKDGRFITNDPGTRRGADFTYKFDVLYNAIHDWREDRDILNGRKVMIVVNNQ